MEKHGAADLVHDNLQDSRMERDTRAKEGEWVTVSRKGKEKVGKGHNVVPKKANVAICSNLVSKKFSFGSNNMHAGSSSNAKVKSLSNTKVGPNEKKDPPSTLDSLGTPQVAFKDQNITHTPLPEEEEEKRRGSETTLATWGLAAVIASSSPLLMEPKEEMRARTKEWGVVATVAPYYCRLRHICRRH
ncbi:hypothetical protein HN51_059463 [Arachis hypogaea]